MRFLKLDKTVVSAEQIRASLQSGSDSLRAVADTSSTREGTVFGWLLELGTSGDFDLAAKTFHEVSEVLEKLARVNSEQEVARILESDT